MVLLTLKNLQQQTFQVEIDITASVKELKEKIEKDRGKDYPAVGQKLIYAGKILQDDNKLESYSMDVNKFLVIMVTKPKTSTPPPEACSESMDTTPATTSSSAADTSESSTTTTASSTTSTSTTSSSSTTSTSSTATTTTSTPATPAAGGEGDAGSAAASNAESLLVMGDDFNKMVDNIMEMGYERRMVERALRASFNNPYTAVQYLVDGIPDNVGDPEPAVGGGDGGDGEGDLTDEGTVAEAIAAAAAASGGSGEGGGGGGGSAVVGTADDPLAFLRNQPQFVQMTQMMRSNPQLLDAFLQQIRTTNPGLLRAIQDNQEAFVRMINQPQAPTGGSGGSGGGDADAPSGGGGGGGGGGGSGRGTTIMLTQQDRDAIDRLRGLGNFPEELVVQAYFACEKNENLAAEFLFSQSWD